MERLNGFHIVGKHPLKSFVDIRKEFISTLQNFPEESVFESKILKWTATTAQKYSIIDSECARIARNHINYMQMRAELRLQQEAKQDLLHRPKQNRIIAAPSPSIDITKHIGQISPVPKGFSKDVVTPTLSSGSPTTNQPK